MSLDFRKNTYRPKRQDSRFRTSYAQMSQWMTKNPKQNKDITQSMMVSMPNALRDIRPVNPNYDSSSVPLQLGASMSAIDETSPNHLRYSHNAGYDDFHRAFRSVSNQWPSTSYPVFGPPRLRHGRAGGSWRHVKEVLQAGGSRIVFVDGFVRCDDNRRIDEVPGGHLIQPNAKNMVLHSRTSNNPGKVGGMTIYHLSSRQGIEHNNWNVMR